MSKCSTRILTLRNVGLETPDYWFGTRENPALVCLEGIREWWDVPDRTTKIRIHGCEAGDPRWAIRVTAIRFPGECWVQTLRGGLKRVYISWDFGDFLEECRDRGLNAVWLEIVK